MPTRLAADGKALLPIVISPLASQGTKDIAAELAGYLGRVTGAEFTVQTGDGAEGIVLGTLVQFPDAALEQPLAIHDTYNGKEAYIIRTESKRVRLIGATDLGALTCCLPFPRGDWLSLVFPGEGMGSGAVDPQPFRKS